MTDYFEIIIIEIPKVVKAYKKTPNDEVLQWMLFLDNPEKEEVTRIMEENKDIKEAKEELAGLKEERLQKEIPELKEAGSIDNLKVYEPVGCARCQKTGYLDRVALGEVIELDETLKSAIMNDIKHLDINVVKTSQESISLRQDGYMKILRGLTTLEEVLRVIEA